MSNPFRPEQPAHTLTAADLCGRCARMGHSCCVASPAEAHLFFPLSEAEWQRLLPFSHLAYHYPATLEQTCPGDDAIRQSEPNCQEFVGAMCSLFPNAHKQIQALFPLPGRHYRIAIRRNGECVFLGNQGCVLPRAHRPRYCVLFPSWVHGTEVTHLVPETCLVVGAGKNPGGICTLMTTTRKETLALYAALRQDWGLQ